MFAKESSFIEEMGTEAGAVRYQTCFPSKLDVSNNRDALEVPSTEANSKPVGGLYEGALKDASFAEEEASLGI